MPGFPPGLPMGCLFSSLLASADDGGSPTAMVVAADCSLLEYGGGTTAAEVVVETGQDCALCSSDELFFDCYPKAAPPHAELEPGQVYFLLPAKELRRRFSGEDVAELAMRASTALKRAAEKEGRRRRRRRTVLAAEVGGDADNLKWWPPPPSAVGAVEKKKKKKYGELAGLRRELSTVEEGSEDCTDLLLSSH